LTAVDTPKTEPSSLRRPRALRPGDRVAVLTCSSPCNQDRLKLGLDVLRFVGLEPVVYPSALADGAFRPFLAGGDEARATDLRTALLDDTIAGVLLAGGGYGSQRVLEVMDWSGVDAVAPKVVVGYSDVTGILEALAARLGWASLIGPMVSEEEFAESYSFSSLLRCLMFPDQVRTLHYDRAVTVVSGAAEGVTLGGCLSLLAGSLGTKTSFPARGGILLLEDVEENDARVDTMLTHLRRSGYLDGVAGIVCGTYHECGTVEQIQPVLEERLGSLGVPMIGWANVGHGGHVQTFPIGVRARLDADARTLQILEPPLVPAQQEPR